MNKKTVFIGSSSEALSIVDKVEALLSDSYEIIRWGQNLLHPIRVHWIVSLKMQSR